jgi:cytoskeletal protein CcmA (bactofilin family)
VVDITDTTDSSDATGDTGALRVEGGASIAKKLFVGTDADIDGTLETDALSINGTTVTATAAELNILDGVTASATDINLIDGITNGTVIASKAIITDSNKDITGGRNITISGELDAATLDISGDADIDGTLEADAITVNGTALNTVIAGVTVTDATNSAHVLVTDNESTNEDNLITFVENGTSSTGNVGLEMDGDLTYNPSTGRLTATQLAGTLQTAAQANVTSLGTLTTLTVDNVIINGSTIGHTGDTDLMTVASGVLTVAGEVDATSLDISGDADIDGTLEADAITVNGTALNTVIADEATALAIALG